MQTTLTRTPKHIYDPAFQYVKAEHTDIRKTFQRVKQDAQRTVSEAKDNDTMDKMINSWFVLEGN